MIESVRKEIQQPESPHENVAHKVINFLNENGAFSTIGPQDPENYKGRNFELRMFEKR